MHQNNIMNVRNSSAWISGKLKVNTSSCPKVNNFSDAMNATNYYVSTTRLVLQADPDSPPSWQDLYTALPTLRFQDRIKGFQLNKQADNP